MENKKLREEEENEIDKELLKEELNEETKLLIDNLKHSKKRNKYYFKWDNENLKLLKKKNNKEVKISDKNRDKSQNNKKNNAINEIKKNIDETKNNINKIRNKINEIQSNINESQNDLNEKRENENDDIKEIQEIFDGINPNQIIKNNSKKIMEKENDYQLIVNLSNFNEGKPLYIKCINNELITKESQNYLVYIFRDSNGGEINAYAYDKDIPKFNSKIKKNSIYVITNYLVRNKISSSFLLNNFRLILNNETKIKPMPPDPCFNNIHFNFINIEDLFYFKEGTIIDICGIIYDGGKTEIIKTKHGNKIIRNILISDTSKKKIYITLWEKFSNDKRIKYEIGEIIAIKYCKIILYPEKIKKLTTTNLSFIQNSTSDYEKDIQLKEFYKKNNNINDFSFVFNPPDYVYLEEIREKIIYNIKNEVDNCQMPFLTKAYIDEISLDNNCIYNGCPLCHKKLNYIEENEKNNIPQEMKYKCFYCKKYFEKPKFTFKLLFRARDANTKVLFNMIGDEAKKFLNIEPDNVNQYLDEENYEEIKKIENNVLFKEYIFLGKLRSYKLGLNGKIVNQAKVEHFEKAEGDNLKRVLQLIEPD